jgi:nucleotide-binding universal stress UspA family protein
MNSILVPIDFSDCSKDAMNAAFQLACILEAKIEVVHVYDRPVIGFVDLKIDHTKHAKLRKEIEAKLLGFLSAFDKEGVSIASSILMDIPLNEILNQARFKDTTLVVMGSQGASGFKEMLVGSNTQKMVRSAHCPVLSLKNEVSNFALNNIVLASNFYRELELIFPRIEGFLAPFRPTYHLLKVNTPQQFETTRYSESLMEGFAKRFLLTNYTTNVYNDNQVEAGILNFSKACKADAIVIVTHGRKGIEHFINGSLAEDVVNHAHTPVLSFTLNDSDKSTHELFPE